EPHDRPRGGALAPSGDARSARRASHDRGARPCLRRLRRDSAWSLLRPQHVDAAACTALAATTVPSATALPEGFKDAARRSSGTVPMSRHTVPRTSRPYAARGLVIPSLLIIDCSVVRFIPSRVAAPR